MRNRQLEVIAAACQIELLESRKMFSTSVNLDTSALQTLSGQNEQFEPAMNFNGSKGVLVTATPGSGGTAGSLITATLLDPNGVPTSTMVQVNSGVLTLDDHPDVVVATDGSFVVTWTSINAVYFQQFNSSAVPTGVATKVTGALVADNSAVAYTTGGAFVVTYQAINGVSGLDVFAQLYNADGSANGTAITVNTTAAGTQQNPRVASDANGNFIVTWQGATGTPALDNIYSQRFTSTGTRVGSQTVVNTTTAGEQANPDISATSDGSFIIAWDSTNAGLTAIKFQQFDSAGAAVGAEMSATPASTSLQSNPAVVIRSDGIFGIAWVDIDGTSTPSTQACYFLPNGTAITDTVTFSTQAGLDQRPAIQFIASGNATVAYGTSVGSVVNTAVATLVPTLSVDGTSAANVISAAFSNLLVSVTIDGTQSDFPTALLSAVDIEAGDGNDTLNVTGDPSMWNGDLTIEGGDGNDAITLGNLRATVLGGDGDDVITVGSGNDYLDGGAGNDSIVGGSGSDFITGSDGNDTLVSGSGASILDGGAGDDVLHANNVGELLEGDDGNDTIYGGTGNDTLSGGTGNDVLYSGGGADSINGGDGDDMMYSGTGNSTIRGGDGFDTVSYALDTAPVSVKLGGYSHNGVAGQSDFIAADVEAAIGGSGNDTLVAGSAANNLFGGPGNDLLEGGSGNDLLDGNNGNDTLLAGTGSDNFIGASGNDTVSFANQSGKLSINIDGLADSGLRGQHDTIQLSVENIIAGSGADSITGSKSNNMIQGGAGSDTIQGLGGDDTLIAGSGSDSINGGSGNDLIKGGNGTDFLNGDTGNDTIYAGSGIDVMHGNTGNDSLIAGSGNDSLYGDAGNDTLVTGTGIDLLNGGTGLDKALAKKTDILKAIETLLHGVPK